MRYSSILISFLMAALILLSFTSARAQSPGDTIGWMQFDNQSLASIGHKIAVDRNGGRHFVWHQFCPSPIPWDIRYAYIDQSGSRTDYDLGTGAYPQIALDSDNRPGITFHNDDWQLIYWTHEGRYILPDDGMWPMLSIDHQDHIHIIYYWYGGERNIGYMRSEDNGVTWTTPVKVDTAITPSYMITSSPVSDKVAIVYTYNLTRELPIGIYYIQSMDGQNWDWQNGAVNITNYPDSIHVTGDDCDAVYDYNDNLHIIWNAQRYDYSGFYDSVYIRHYDISSGQTSVVAAVGPWPEDSNCIVGHWSNVMCKMSIATAVGPLLAVTYTRFEPKDCSQGGSADGEIFLQLSNDGQTWSYPMDLTHSWTPNCASGYCNSDHWGSLAERIDGYAHLFYVNDKDAGDRVYGEGSDTDNPMLYYRVPIDASNIAEGGVALPNRIGLSQNYPNPFNAQTTIWYSLTKESNIKIELFDLLGKKIETLKEGSVSAGSHIISWDATAFPSGIYFCRLQTETGSQSRRMILLK